MLNLRKIALNMKKDAGAYLTPKGKEMLTKLEQPSQEEELLFPDTAMQTVLMMVALSPSVSLDRLLSDIDAYSDNPEEEREDVTDAWARAIDEEYMLYEEPIEYPTGDTSTLPFNLPPGITAVKLNMKKSTI